MSYLVIRMHKEDVVLPRFKWVILQYLTSPSGCAKKTMFCRVPHVILRVSPRHPDAQIGRRLQRSKCHPTCLTSPRHPDAQRRRRLPRSKCHPTCLTSSSRRTKKTLFCRVPNVILHVLPRHPGAQRRRCFAEVLSV